MEIVQNFIPVGRKNRPGTPLHGPKFITIHDTANDANGANALNHAEYLKGDEAANKPVSWHYTVDDKRAVQHLPNTEKGFHAGDGGEGPGNTSSIGIEICENRDGNRGKAEDNAAELAAKLLNNYNLNIEALVQHHKWTGKNCPHIIRERPNGWEQFIEKVKEKL